MRVWPAAAVVVLIGFVGLIAIGCSGAVVHWGDEPVAQEWPLAVWVPAEWLADVLDAQHEAVVEERIWCRGNAGLLPDGAPMSIVGAEASERDLERFFDPLGEAELSWIRDLAALTARERGLSPEPLPEFRIISHDRLRDAACHALLHEEQVGDAGDLWQFERILGINHAEWTPAVLSALWAYSLGGWYSPDTKAVTLIGSTPLPRYAFELVAHELVHAMQDQYLEGENDDVYVDVTHDYGTAISWVIEGDATVAEAVVHSPEAAALRDTYAWGPEGDWLADRTGLSLALTPLLGQEFAARYTDGADYVRTQQRVGGWQRVNELLMDPPQSSEQILHADKLESREPPIDAERLAELRRMVFDPREEPTATTMGESYLANLIGFSTQEPTLAAEAAAGWGGDELAVWSMVDGRRDATAIWVIAFDDAAERREGVAGLREWLIAHSGATAVADRSGRAIAYDGAAGAIRVVDSADTLWLIASSNRRTADEITYNVLRLAADPGWWE